MDVHKINNTPEINGRSNRSTVRNKYAINFNGGNKDISNGEVDMAIKITVLATNDTLIAARSRSLFGLSTTS